MTAPAPAVVVLLVTAGTAEEGERIARALIDERLVACVNLVGPIRSIYRWEGAVESASECLLILKARAADVDAVAARVRALHSYDVPEVLALPVSAGSAPYLSWLVEATARGA